MRVPHTLQKLNNVRLKSHVYTYVPSKVPLFNRNADLSYRSSFPKLHTSATRSNNARKSDSYHPFPLPSAINAIPPSPISQLPFPTSPLRGSWSRTPISSAPVASLGQLQKLLRSYSGEKSEPTSASTTGGTLSIQHAEAVWLLYSTLPQAYRRTFPLSVLHQTFRQVVPRYSDIKTLIGNPRTRNPSIVRDHRRKVRKLAAEWEMRLRVVAGDILAPRRNGARQEGENMKEVSHTPGVLTGGLRKLSILGDKTGCESILLELKSRFPPSPSCSSSDSASSLTPMVSPSEWRTLYDYSLRSIVRWLSLNIYRAPTAQGEILSAISSLKRLISGMQSQGVPAGEQTALVLLDAGRHSSSPAVVQDQKVREGFEDLTRVILEGGYGIKRREKGRDLGALELGWEGLKVDLPTQVKLAVIEMMGRKGDLWGMIVAFERMYPDLPVLSSPAYSLASPSASTVKPTSASGLGELQENVTEAEAARTNLGSEELMEEEIPTLSSMIAKEQAERAERDWLGRFRHSDADISDTVTSASANIAGPVEATETMELESSYRRPFSAYLPSVPMPLSLSSFSSHPSYAHADVNSIPPDYMIKTMLHYIYLHRHPDPDVTFHGGRGRQNVREMGLYVCRVGLRFAALEQVRWLSELVASSSASASSFTSSDPTSNPNLEITQKRIHPDPLWFNTALRIVLSSAGHNKKAIGKTGVLREEIEGLKRRLEEEIEVLEMLRASKAETANVVTADVSACESSVDTSEGQLNDITASTPSLTPNTNIHMNINIDIPTHLRSLQTKLDQLASLKEEIEHRKEVANARKSRAKVRAAEAQALVEPQSAEVEAVATENEMKMNGKEEQGKEVYMSGIALA